VSDQNQQGIIKTRSGTWQWELTSLRAWPKSDVTGKRLGFEDPANALNAMSLELEPDGDELSEKSIRHLSLALLVDGASKTTPASCGSLTRWTGVEAKTPSRSFEYHFTAWNTDRRSCTFRRDGRWAT